MEKKQNPNPKHIRSFWPLVIIFTISALLGGIILGAAYSSILEDEISSFSFKIHKEATKCDQKQTTSKCLEVK